MNATRIFALLALSAVGLAVVACMSVATTDVKPAVTPTPFPESAFTPVATDVRPTVVTAPPTESASPISVTTAAATPTGAAALAAEDIDCMSACHVPDKNDLPGASAKPQPASHKEYATCLACHATLAKPSLPTTHLGRLDPACVECHQAK